MHTLRIALEPQLTHACGPQVHWAWREVLATLGYAWAEVELDEACDIAFVADASLAPRARLSVHADHAAWAAPASRRLAKLCHDGEWPVLAFERQPIESAPVRLSDGDDAGRWWLSRDIAFDLFWLATGQEERYWPQNVHGFYDLSGAPALRDGVLQQAPAMQMLSALGCLLHRMGTPAPAPRWPGGKRAAVAISHDVDYPEVIRWLEPARVLVRDGVKAVGPALDVLSGKRTHWHFASWQALEREYGARSAFYFMARQGSLFEYSFGAPDAFYDVASPRYTRLLRDLVGQGWEVGLQASYRANENRARFAAEKQKIEAACGRPIAGNRHHYWHMNPNDVEETLLMHEQIGFEYDSSLTHDRYLGWRRGLSTPFYPFHQKKRRELRTLQLPVAWMDAQVFVYTSPGDAERRRLLNNLIDRAAEDGGTFIINIHDYVFDDALFPGWSRALRDALDHIRERGDFWHATPAELARHWSARYQAIRASSQGLRQGA